MYHNTWVTIPSRHHKNIYPNIFLYQFFSTALKDTLISDLSEQSIWTEDTSVEIWQESHFEPPHCVICIWFSKIRFHVVYLLFRLHKINLDTMWICQKSDLGWRSELFVLLSHFRWRISSSLCQSFQPKPKTIKVNSQCKEMIHIYVHHEQVRHCLPWLHITDLSILSRKTSNHHSRNKSLYDSTIKVTFKAITVKILLKL